MLKICRNAFQRITEQREEYRQFKLPEGQITEHLVNIQEKIDPKDFKTSYLRALTLKKKEFNWTKDFIQDWVKAFDYEKKLQEESFKLKKAQRNRQIKAQPLPQGNQAQGQPPAPEGPPIKLEEKRQLTKEGEKSMQKLPGEKPQKRVKRDDSGVQKVQK